MRRKCNWIWFAIAGGAAGIVNGFFGGGGGMVLVPILVAKCGLGRKEAFATSIAVILPLCVLSASVYFIKGEIEIAAALPYMAGGLMGGLLGGKLFKKTSEVWIRRIFALLILYGAWRSFV